MVVFDRGVLGHRTHITVRASQFGAGIAEELSCAVAACSACVGGVGEAAAFGFSIFWIASRS